MKHSLLLVVVGFDRWPNPHVLFLLALFGHHVGDTKPHEYRDSAAHGCVGIRVGAVRTGKAEQALTAARVGGFVGDIAALEESASVLRRGAEGHTEDVGPVAYLPEEALVTVKFGLMDICKAIFETQPH